MKTGVGIILIPPSLSGVWMSQRIAEGDVYHGFWQVPGGASEAFELPEETALRELEEETGLKYKWERFMAAKSTSFDGTCRFPDGTYYRSIQYALLTRGIPQRREPDKCGPWEIVPWAKIFFLPLFGGMRELFPSLDKA